MIFLLKKAVFWDVAPCSLVEVYRRFRGAYCLHYQGDEEAANTSETSVNLYQIIRHNDPEDSHLHTRRHENLKSQDILVSCIIYEININNLVILFST
jgi:hypothetical protein